MTGRDLINFITRNHLENIRVQTEWTDMLTWSVFIDDEHLKEIEYNWRFNGMHDIRFHDWTKFDCDDEDSEVPSVTIVEEVALKLRGLA